MIIQLFLTPLYNGNIAETTWRTASDNIRRKYGYAYDHLNRLRDAYYQMPGTTMPLAQCYDEYITYDKNGNILTLFRNGEVDDPNNVQEIDDLTYQYDDGNKLINVLDDTEHSAGFKDVNIESDSSVDDFEYDIYGNLVIDRNKGITEILYNHLNLPKKITFGTSGTIEYLYDANGTKLKKKVTEGTTVTNTHYIDGYQYKEDKLDFFPTAEGYVKVTHTSAGGVGGGTTSYNYVFNYTDHLGNIRLRYAINPLNQWLEILEEDHYYPFGLKHKGYNAQNYVFGSILEGPIQLIPTNPNLLDSYKYKFNGMEWQDEMNLNYYDFGARNYDPAIGRWMNIDPHAERYAEWSPYSYCFNNPLIFIDPDGRDPIYGKNFWGRTKLIGDDGKEDGQSYLVSGAVKRDVKSATKAGGDYTGSLAESDNVFKIPTGGVMDDVINSVNDTRTSEKEHGGHANFGDANATRWDEGPPAFAFTDTDGVEKVKATLKMFVVGGKNTMPADASNVEFWWHTHPNTTVNGTSLGNSNPSEADFRGQTTMTNRGFKGNTFVIGVRSGTVTFFNSKKPLITVKYSDFKTMGGK